MWSMRKMLVAVAALVLAVSLQGCGGEDKKPELKDELNKAVGAWNDEAHANELLGGVRIAQDKKNSVQQIGEALVVAKAKAKAKMDGASEPNDAAKKLMERLDGLLKKADPKVENKKEESKKEESKKHKEEDNIAMDEGPNTEASKKETSKPGRLEPGVAVAAKNNA